MSADNNTSAREIQIAKWISWTYFLFNQPSNVYFILKYERRNSKSK